MMTDRVTDEELTMLALKAQSRLIDVEKENAALRQLVKDLSVWAQDGFLLIGVTYKTEWEQRYEQLQQRIQDILGERAL